MEKKSHTKLLNMFVRVGGDCGPPPPVAAPLVPRCALLTAATPRLTTRDADLAEGVEEGIGVPSEEVVDGSGQVVGADFGGQARQQAPKGACAWELQSEFVLQATEGRLDRMAQSVEPLHRTLPVRTRRLSAL